MHLSFLSCLLVALAGGLLARREWRCWGARPASGQGGREGRSRFLALPGIIASPLFALTILAQWSASLFLHPCQ